MELQDQVLSFPLNNTLTRQVFEYDIDGIKLLFMYDSGAQIPVWCINPEILIKAYPNTRKTEFKCEISGFGNYTEISDIYVIPLFELSTGSISFKIQNLFVATLFKPYIGCDFLLSETMFSKTDMVITRRKKRNLMITFDKIDRPLVCTARINNKMVKSVSVWSQKL